MEEARVSKRPFFAYYACHHTHHPQFVNPNNIGISKLKGGRNNYYGDAVVEMVF